VDFGINSLVHFYFRRDFNLELSVLQISQILFFFDVFFDIAPKNSSVTTLLRIRKLVSLVAVIVVNFVMNKSTVVCVS